MPEPVAGRTIPIPGPRLWPYVVIGGPVAVIWYLGAWDWLQNLIIYGSGTLVHGHGFVSGSLSAPLSWAAWAAMILIPLPAFRSFLWNILGWEYVTVAAEGLVVERKFLGIPLYRAEVYDLRRIANLRAESPASKKNPTPPDLFRPNQQGAIAFDYGTQTIRFGYSLFANRELADDIAAGLGSWIARAAGGQAAVNPVL